MLAYLQPRAPVVKPPSLASYLPQMASDMHGSSSVTDARSALECVYGSNSKEVRAYDAWRASGNLEMSGLLASEVTNAEALVNRNW